MAQTSDDRDINTHIDLIVLQGLEHHPHGCPLPYLTQLFRFINAKLLVVDAQHLCCVIRNHWRPRGPVARGHVIVYLSLPMLGRWVEVWTDGSE